MLLLPIQQKRRRKKEKERQITDIHVQLSPFSIQVINFAALLLPYESGIELVAPQRNPAGPQIDEVGKAEKRGVLLVAGGRRRGRRRGGLRQRGLVVAGESGRLGGGGADVLRGGGGGAGELGGEVGEVEEGGLAFDGEGGDVVGARGHLGGGEGAEPDARFLLRLANFGNPFAPIAHPDAAVRRAIALPAPLLGREGFVGLRGGGGGGGEEGAAMARRGRWFHGGRRRSAGSVEGAAERGF